MTLSQAQPRAWLLVSAFIACLLVILPFKTSANHPGAVVLVDDSDVTPDGGGCGTAANKCNTIQAGVDHALAGQKVAVAAGTYDELVTVPKQLKIEGAQKGKNGTTRTVAVGQESVVNGGFNLQGNRIVVNGFIIQNNAGGPGVQTSPLFSGYKIENNIIRNSVMGLYLHSSGESQTEVSRNLFQTNNAAGAAAGNGIYSDQGLVNAEISRNRFTGNENTSFTLTRGAVSDPKNNDVEFSRNTATGERTLVNMYYTMNSEISRNTATAFVPNGSAVFLAGGNDKINIEHNTLRDADFSGIRVRNMVGDNTRLEISDNTITGMGDFGIAAGSAHNDVPDSGIGNAMTDSKIEDNEVRNNGAAYSADGIFLGPNTANNTIEDNEARLNAHHDAHDDSVGTSTASTANIWDDNDCSTDSPNGLCD